MLMTHRLLFCVLTLAVLFGCDNNPRRTVVITSPPRQQVTVTQPGAPTPVAQTDIMDSSALDLATIADLLRSGRVQDADTLQATINNPANGLNNVDLDHDGNIDPITVTEVPSPTGGRQFNLTANPATKPPVVVANIDVTMTNGQVLVQAGYPSYVTGYQNNYYQYNAAANVAFLAWALSSRPMYMAQPYSSYSWYTPQHVYAPDTVTQRRTTYTTQTQVSPVQRTAPPATFTQQAQAEKVPSGFAPSANALAAPTTNNLNDRAVAQDFKVRNSTQPVARATGFGASAATTQATTPTTTTSPTTAPTTQYAVQSFQAPSSATTTGTTSRPSFNTGSAPATRTSPTTASTSTSTSSRPSFQSSRPSAPRTSPTK